MEHMDSTGGYTIPTVVEETTVGCKSSTLLQNVSPKTVHVSPLLVEYLAGVSGGVAVVCVGHPFDTMKTRLQTAPKNFYSSTLDAVSRTFRLEGIRGFYTGMLSPLLGQMFFRAASFTTYRYSVSHMTRNRSVDHATATQLMLCGSITGFVIAFVEVYRPCVMHIFRSFLNFSLLITVFLRPLWI